MAKIGIVLAGGMSHGAYEIGCLRAVEEFFGKEAIVSISASSIGVLNAYAFGIGKLDELEREWSAIDTKESGRFFPAYSGNTALNERIRAMIGEQSALPFELFASIWNFTERKIEYMPFHALSAKDLRNYMCAAIAIPLFHKGVRLNGSTLFDGAFLDNIPVYPLLEKPLDYIICMYFDGRSYLFENEAFDRKFIKLYQFPKQGRLEFMTFDPNRFENMVQFGYHYTLQTLTELFASATPTEIYQRIRDRETVNREKAQPRLTGDVVLSNINTLTARYAKRVSKRTIL
ncbi:MAG: hypothetical protein E7668_05835 [Ruminococcaceae bacterium]|nr:hypothetical protein [Oscillospiraceae bacterium]